MPIDKFCLEVYLGLYALCIHWTVLQAAQIVARDPLQSGVLRARTHANGDGTYGCVNGSNGALLGRGHPHGMYNPGGRVGLLQVGHRTMNWHSPWTNREQHARDQTEHGASPTNRHDHCLCFPADDASRPQLATRISAAHLVGTCNQDLGHADMRLVKF